MARPKKRRYPLIGFDNDELEQIADDLQAKWFYSASSTYRTTLKMFLAKLKEHGYEIRKVN